MIGADLKAIIAAKIAAATSGGGATADPSLALACRIYVGSLYYDLTADDITALFEGFGEVTKCELQMDAVTGRSKGFCFLEFKTPEQAQAAMAMNGFEIAGRKVILRH
jgi:RNA-binding protein 23/39